jgi:hypothetical protein
LIKLIERLKQLKQLDFLDDNIQFKNLSKNHIIYNINQALVKYLKDLNDSYDIQIDN